MCCRRGQPNLNPALRTSVVGHQVEEGLPDFLPGERLRVLQAVQQRADGVELSLSVHRSHAVPVRKLALSQEVQDVPLNGNGCCLKLMQLKLYFRLLQHYWNVY